MFTCTVCGGQFERTGSRGPVSRYCSDACRAKKKRERPERKDYEREYRRRVRASGALRRYEFEYNRRPEVRSRNAERMRFKWHNDPEYRERQLARWRNAFADVAIPAPYTGHRWLDRARGVVTKGYVDPMCPSSDDYYDDMGEAVLALLEGRDPKQAVKEYRSKEYASRRLFIRLGDWGDDEDQQDKFFERVMPQVESAEDEYMAGWYVATRYSHGENGRPSRNRQQQPSRRRMKDGKGWKKHAA